MHVVNIYSKRVVPTALRRMRNARKREAVDNGRKKRANKAGDGLLEGFAIQLPGGMNLKTPDTERHAPPRGAEPDGSGKTMLLDSIIRQADSTARNQIAPRKTT